MNMSRFKVGDRVFINWGGFHGEYIVSRASHGTYWICKEENMGRKPLREILIPAPSLTLIGE